MSSVSPSVINYLKNSGLAKIHIIEVMNKQTELGKVKCYRCLGDFFFFKSLLTSKVPVKAFYLESDKNLKCVMWSSSGQIKKDYLFKKWPRIQSKNMATVVQDETDLQYSLWVFDAPFW